MAKRKLRTKDVIEKMYQARGNLTAVAKACNVTRRTIQNYVNDYPAVKEALDDARETMLDAAESVLYKKVLAGSTPELLFFLKTQGYKRGYSERHQYEHTWQTQLPEGYEPDEVQRQFAQLIAQAASQVKDESSSD